VLSRRLKSQCAPVYLTLASISQGVVLSALAARVEATYPEFGAGDWLLTTATFIAVLGL
jgi:hypothetical protein